MSGWRSVGGILLIVLTAGCTAQAQQTTPVAVEKPAGDATVTTSPSVPPAQLGITVASVVDGRSVMLSDGSKAEVTALVQPGPCWAEAATTFAKNMLLNQQVRYDRATGRAQPRGRHGLRVARAGQRRRSRRGHAERGAAGSRRSRTAGPDRTVGIAVRWQGHP